MALPEDHLVIQIAPGADPDDPATWADRWTVITSDVRQSSSVTITAGKPDEGALVSPSTCDLVLNNRDGHYSSHNRVGRYYPLLGRNTPLRVVWDELTPASRGFESGISTWVAHANASVAATSAQARTGTQAMEITATAGGAAAARHVDTVTDGAPVVPEEEIDVAAWFRAAATPRSVQLGFNFYTAAGGFVSSSFGTSITDTTVGWTRAAHTGTVPATAAFAVAIVQVLAAAAAEVHYVDDVELGVDLFAGLIRALPASWDVSGNDAWVSVHADGILSRQGQQLTKPIDSPIRANTIGAATQPAAYWPCEDPELATIAASAVDGAPLRPYVSGTPELGSVPQFGSNLAPVGSTGAVELPSGWAMQGDVAGTTSDWSVELWFDGSAFFRIYAPDAPTIENYRFNSNSQGYDLVAWDENGLSILNHTDIFGSFDPPGFVPWPDGDIAGIHHLVLTCDRLELGSTFKLYLDGVEINSSSEFFGPGPVSQLIVGGGRAYSHIGIWPSTLTAAEVLDRFNAGEGYPGELAGDRLTRVSSERGVAFQLMGAAADTAAMGPQPIGTFQTVIRDAEAADGGDLCEHGGGLCYRTRADRYNQDVLMALEIAPGDVTPDLAPTDDDQKLVNEVTAQRSAGGEFTYIDTASQDGTADQPAAGRYDRTVRTNLASQIQLGDYASWLVHLGTVAEPRWPRVGFRLQKNPELIPQWLAMITKVGRRFTVDHSFTQLTGVDVDLLAEGWSQTINRKQWEVTINAAPASPWSTLWVPGDTDRGRWDTAGSSLDAAVGTADTSFVVNTSKGPRWVDSATFPAMFPFDVVIVGEVMRVTAITGTTNAQTCTVTRQINGVLKEHAAGAAVRLAHPFHFPR